MTWLGMGRGAGAAGAHGNVAHLHNQGLATHIAEADVQVARQPKARQVESRPVEGDVAKARAEPGEKPVAKAAQAGRFGRQLRQTKLQGPGKADDARHVGRAAPQSAFLPAAVDLRFEADARTAAQTYKAPIPLGP